MKTKKTEMVTYRPGEGVPMAITRVIGGPNKPGHLSVSMAGADVPARRYTCDVVDVYQTDLEVQLLFGQRKVGNGSIIDLRSLLVIHLSFDSVARFVQTIDQYDVWVERLRAIGVTAYGLATILQEPIQTHSLNANNIIAGYAGREATLDFYLSSAFVFAGLPTASHMPMDPVVRVTLPTALFLSIVDKLREISAKLPQIEGEDHD